MPLRYVAAVVRVVQRGRFSIYVYAEVGHRRHLPHCHVRWGDGKCVVSLKDPARVAGEDLPPAGWALVEEYLDEIRRTWNRLNPEGPQV